MFKVTDAFLVLCDDVDVALGPGLFAVEEHLVLEVLWFDKKWLDWVFVLMVDGLVIYSLLVIINSSNGYIFFFSSIL